MLTMEAATLGAGLGSGLISGISNLFGQSQQFKEQKKLLALQYQQNLEQWNRENEYNSPVQQMQRLKDAGLNANLVYGNGGVTQSAASSPQMGVADAPNYGESIGQSMGTMLQYAAQAQQYYINDSTRKNIDADTNAKEIASGLQAVETAIKNKQLDYADEFFKQTNEKLKSQVNLNGSMVTLNGSKVSEINANIDLIHSSTKLNTKQVDVLEQSMRESQARIQLIGQQISESISRVGLNHSLVNLNHAHAQLANAQTENVKQDTQYKKVATFDKVLDVKFKDKTSDGLIDYTNQSFQWLLKSHKFQSLTQEKQFDLLKTWGDLKEKYELKKLRNAGNKVDFMGIDVGNLYNFMFEKQDDTYGDEFNNYDSTK